MANRTFRTHGGTLEIDAVQLYAEVSVGAAGAPTLVSSPGIASVERTGAGTYKVTLSDRYFKLLNVHASNEGDDDATFRIDSEDVNSNDPHVVVETLVAGSAADLTSGSKFRCTFHLRNSSQDT